MSDLIWSDLIKSYLVSYLILSYLIVSYLILSYLILSFLAVSCLILYIIYFMSYLILYLITLVTGAGAPLEWYAGGSFRCVLSVDEFVGAWVDDRANGLPWSELPLCLALLMERWVSWTKRHVLPLQVVPAFTVLCRRFRGNVGAVDAGGFYRQFSPSPALYWGVTMKRRWSGRNACATFICEYLCCHWKRFLWSEDEWFWKWRNQPPEWRRVAAAEEVLQESLNRNRGPKQWGLPGWEFCHAD